MVGDDDDVFEKHFDAVTLITNALSFAVVCRMRARGLKPQRDHVTRVTVHHCRAQLVLVA
jgi:hypothetical protein